MYKKISIPILSFLIVIVGCDEPTEDNTSELLCGGGSYTTKNIMTNISEEIYNNDESVKAYSKYSWTSDGSNRILNGNGIPNHPVGTFPNPDNPNTISEQNVSAQFTLCPTIVSEIGVQAGGPSGAIAYAINSVKFDPATAGRCDNSGRCSLAGGSGAWSIEALGHDTFDFGDDMNHAHVQPNGAYHYHGIPERFLDKIGKGREMTLVGWAADGFPVYARYAYTDPNDSDSLIKVMNSSWQIKSQGDAGRPATKNSNNQIIPMGAFTQDYEYKEGSGDLDQCNGRVGVTPEFPEGIYYYMVTDSFPYFSRCLKGSF